MKKKNVIVAIGKYDHGRLWTKDGDQCERGSDGIGSADEGGYTGTGRVSRGCDTKRRGITGSYRQFFNKQQCNEGK